MALRFLVTGGNGNWTSTSNWSLTSGGVSGLPAPVAGDAVTFDSSSGSANITLDTAAQACTSLNITSGYTGTMTFTNTLTTAGTTTLGANMVFAGSAALILNATCTLTSSGKTISVPLTIGSGLATLTLGDNVAVTAAFTTLATTAQAINANTLTLSAGMNLGVTTGAVSGTTNFAFNGTGTIQMPSVTTGSFRNNLEINTAGTITMTGQFRYLTGIFKYTAGTFVSTGSTFMLPGAATITANAAGLNFSTFSVSGGNITINGSSGFTMLKFSMLTTGSTITWQSGNTYSITNSFIATSTSAAPDAFVASTGSSAFNLNYSGSTLALAYLNMTDVNANGSSLYVYSGTLTRTTNITTGTQIGSGSSGPLPFPSLRGGFEN